MIRALRNRLCWPGGVTYVTSFLRTKQYVPFSWMAAYEVYADEAKNSLRTQGGDIRTFKLVTATPMGNGIEFLWQCNQHTVINDLD